ncbi:unnamed protein product [Oppiella nova]|uniref:Nuclear receptor domain-containing protein n=1 Tax=Oppiella nova TaxID=334625 RepID=A0A7R9M4Q3_9ACAR|nr:unnamed protein product [Oppiella nova]CAG2170631.1 unnamed protein product [Oppiella nova]
MCDKVMDKKCLICGDKALGNNFDALSCASCKAFFRRHAVKPESLKCCYGNKCRIDLKTRTKCKKCRIDKCFAMGMNKEKRNNLIKTNRQKRELNTKTNSKVYTTYSTTASDSSNSQTDDSVGYTSDSNTTVRQMGDTYDSDLKSHTKHTTHDTNDYHKDITDSEIIDFLDFMSDVRKPEGQSVSVIPIYRPLMDYRNQLNDLESSKLRELLTATDSIRVWPVTAWEIRNNWVMFHKINEQTMKMIQMSKRLSAFNSLCENDRISLIKYGCFALYYMSIVPNYNTDKDCWSFETCTKDKVKFPLETYRSKPLGVYEQYKLFYHKICGEWDMDPVVLDLKKRTLTVGIGTQSIPFDLLREIFADNSNTASNILVY